MTTVAIWIGGLGVAFSLLGVQSLVASTAQTGAVRMLLPTEARGAGVGAGLRRGYLLAMEESRQCGFDKPALDLGWLPSEEDPRAALGNGKLPKLLIAPPAAALLPFGLLAERERLTVLLPLQRGLSLQRIQGQVGSDRLWPVLPSRLLAADRLAESSLKRGWRRVMVIHDGSAEQVAFANRFVEGLSTGGGSVIGINSAPVRIDPAKTATWQRLRDDVDWFGPQALVVLTRPDSALARATKAAAWPSGLALVWPFPPEKPLDQKQLGISSVTRGPGWGDFQSYFQRRWNYRPGLVEAAGYDTGQLTAVAAVMPAGRAGWDLAWLDPKAKPIPLCAALESRQQGKRLALRGAASQLDLVAGLSPAADLQVVDQPARP